MTNHERQPPNSAMPKQTALAERRHSPTAKDPEWERLWLTLERIPWRTLALVPGSEGGPADLALTLAINLSRTGMSHVGAPIVVADGTRIPLQQLSAFTSDVKTCRDGGERVIIALSPTSVSPTATAIAKESDGAVLCVMFGSMRSGETRRTVKLIGAAKFFGVVTIRSDGSVEPASMK